MFTATVSVFVFGHERAKSDNCSCDGLPIRVVAVASAYGWSVLTSVRSKEKTAFVKVGPNLPQLL